MRFEAKDVERPMTKYEKDERVRERGDFISVIPGLLIVLLGLIAYACGR